MCCHAEGVAACGLSLFYDPAPLTGAALWAQESAGVGAFLLVFTALLWRRHLKIFCLAKDISVFTTKRKLFTITFRTVPSLLLHLLGKVQGMAERFNCFVLGVQRSPATDLAPLLPSLCLPCTPLSQRHSDKENYLSSNSLKKEKHLINSFPSRVSFKALAGNEVQWGELERKRWNQPRKGRCSASLVVPLFFTKYTSSDFKSIWGVKGSIARGHMGGRHQNHKQP